MKLLSNKPTKMVKGKCRKCPRGFHAKKGSMMLVSKLCAFHLVAQHVA
jgi:hypothetical protein